MLAIRSANVEDVPTIRQLIRDLAAYEREPAKAVVTEEDLRRDGFGDKPYFHALIAEWDKDAAGFALYFFNYSTWQGRPGLYLEDLFVKPEHRGRGIGRALLTEVARIARDGGCGRLVWQVLDWNEPAIGFYEALGATVCREWLTMRVEGDALATLARAER
jgi:GNAT superfamily N-acetyltransferase